MYTVAPCLRLPLLASLVLSLAAGCSSVKKEKTAHEQMYDRWNTTRAAVLYGLAKKNYENGNLDTARKSADDALALDPRNPPIRVLSARIFIEQGNMESAQRELTE